MTSSSAETRHAQAVSDVTEEEDEEDILGRKSDRMTNTVVWYSMVGLSARLLYLLGTKLTQQWG